MLASFYLECPISWVVVDDTEIGYANSGKRCSMMKLLASPLSFEYFFYEFSVVYFVAPLKLSIFRSFLWSIKLGVQGDWFFDDLIGN